VSGRFVHVTWFDQKAAKQKPGWDIDIYYRRSTDGGATWDPEVRMTNSGKNTRHPQIVATPGNRVCCIWEDGQIFDGAGMVGDPALYAAVSTDNGETWGNTRRITAINAPNGFATHAKAYAFGSRVHLTWQDAPEGQEKQPRAVYYMTSADGGLTWQAPERLTEISQENWVTGAVVGTDSWAVVELAKESNLWYCRRDLSPGHAVYHIKDKAVCAIDDRLFGQFMERPSWGETGVEGAVVAGTNRLQPEALRLLADLHMPIVRFPGGTDVDFMDWHDMVDNVPGRGPERPASTGHTGKSVTNRFGYDEFLGLCRDLKTEPILVVNFQDALLRRKPAKEAALHAAALVAYANAPLGARLPDGMIDWPAVRARNGSPQPWGVKYFQIGNETWIALNALRKEGVANADVPQHYADCLAAYVDAMRSVDPSIRIIADACNPAVAARIHEQLGDRIQYWAQHEYLPWGIESAKLRRAGSPVALEQLTAEEVWNAWVAIPRSFNAAGESTIRGAALEAVRKYGGKAAITEWNWNGGWRQPGAPLDSCFAKGVGAAGYLHAFMRAGDAIEIACQSMTVGHAWPITAIHVDPAGRTPAYMMPTGQVVMFYAKHHGSSLLEIQGLNIPSYSQPLTCGDIRPQEKVAYVDALATADGRAMYFHAINRHFTEDVPVTVDLSEFPGLAAEGMQHLFEGRLNDKPDEGQSPSAGAFHNVRVAHAGTALRIVLPKRSVSIVELGRTRTVE
jgi:alpha-L-arabinofuranosidase